MEAGLPRPGEIVNGKYRIDSMIGRGGMGVVLGATDMSLGRPVAMKFLAPERATRDGAVARFTREARAAAAIQSEHVARVFEVSALPNGAPFIVMESLQGYDLARLLTQRGALEISEACDFILQACEAIGEAHSRGIVHRDLKPQNLFYTQRQDGSPCVKVLDFGISKAMDGGPGQDLTATDTVMGTPLYMSPEQVRSLKNVDARADIWALGSILFELLTAAPIYQAPSASALCAMIAMDEPTPLRARRPQAPPELEAVVSTCLQKDPNARFQDVAQLGRALAPFASPVGQFSATRLSKLGPPIAMSSGSLPPAAQSSAHSLAMGPTMAAPQAATSYAEPANAAFNSGYPPQQHYPSTQSNWQQAPAQSSSGGPPLGLILGGVFGFLVLALGVGGFLLYKSSGSDSDDKPTAATSATVSATPAASVSVPPIPTSASTPSTPPPPPPPAPGPTPVVPKGKDAGAPKQDAGPGPGPSPNNDLAARREAAAQRCQHLRFVMSSNPDRKKGAETAKLQTCIQAQSLSPAVQSSNCERSICRSACELLNDQNCIRQLDFAERQNPLPF